MASRSATANLPAQRSPRERRRRFAVGDLVVDTATHEVLRNGEPLPVPKLSFELLLALIEAAPGVLNGDQLMDRVWSGRIVSNENITQRVRLLRKALGDDAGNPRYVGLVRGEGYRLLAEVEQLPADGSPTPGQSRRLRVLLALSGIALLALTTGIWQLRGQGAYEATAAPPSIAVLPFLSMSNDTAQGYFADGLSEEIINELTRVPGLRVAARTASFAFKNRHATLDDVARELGVTLVLEGSVRRDGGIVRITAQLVSLEDGFHLWSETYTHALADPFSVQEDIARAVAEALSLQLSAPTTAAATPNGEAYAHMLRGLALYWQHTAETTERAIEEFERAVELDPGFARAWVLLGHGYGARSRDRERTEQALADMADAARRAIELAPNYWDAHALDAWVRLSYLDFAGADAAMARALNLRERYGQAREPTGCPVACFHEQLGRVSESLEETRRMQTFDPLGPSVVSWRLLYYLGKRSEALAGYHAMHAVRGREPHLRNFETWMAMEDPDPAAMNTILSRCCPSLAGKWGDAEALLTALRPLVHRQPTLQRGAYAYFAMYAGLHGDHTLAVDFLRRGFLRPGYGSNFLIWHPALAETRATPAFVDFVTELGMVDAWRSSGRWPDFCRPDAQGQVNCTGIQPPAFTRSEAAAAPKM